MKNHHLRKYFPIKIWNVPGGLDLCLYTNEILNYKNLWFCVIWWPPSTYCILSTWMYCMYYQEQPMQEALQVHEEMRNFEFGDPPARSGLWILSHFVATWVWRHQYGQMALTLGYVSSICTDHQPLLGCNWWILNWSTFITIRFSRLKKSRLQLLLWPLYGYFMQEKINRYANFSHNNYKNCLCITNSDRKIPILCKDYSFSLFTLE